MRILNLNSSISINSGVMSTVMNYYNHIDRKKIQYDFFYFIESKDQTYESNIKSNGGIIFYSDIKNFWKFLNELARVLTKYNYEVVHIHDVFITKLIYRVLRKNGVKKIIVHSHATVWSQNKISGVRNRILCSNINRYADYLFACSKAAGNFMYGNDSNFIVMNNAVDTKRFFHDSYKEEYVREKLNLENELVFGHVGAMRLQKNHFFLIEIFRNIINLYPNSILLLIGDGELRTKIEQKVQEYNLDNNVIFLGKITNVEDYYQIMDCMMLPSLFEGLPMVGVEAQCCGVPVLFSDKITEEVGICEFEFLSLNDNVEKWAETAIKLAEMRTNYSEISKKIKKSGYNIDVEAKKMENFYLTCI